MICLNYLKNQKENTFDIIFLDPPYKMNIVDDILSLIWEYKLLKDKGIIADLTNKSFYKKYELKEKLYRSLNNTTREIMKMINQSKFEIENVQYVLL